MASLQPALKGAIQVAYQVEDNELAAEPLPDRDNRHQILLYEATEGGAGVLRQLFESPSAFASVVREALSLCHFDPSTGQDLRRAPSAREDCEAACYDCLMSYYNQPDHLLVDRMQIRDLLLRLAAGSLDVSPGGDSRVEHVRKLKAQCDSTLEEDWLDFIDAAHLRLPNEAQRSFPACETKPDFYYSDLCVAIYIDGPVHDQPTVHDDDVCAEGCLSSDLGVTVIRFRYDDDWRAICAKYVHIFGPVPQAA
jgi:hypothetical protein